MMLLECQQVTLAYENNIVIEDLSFSVEKGDYLFIVGANGSGKSTLIKTILDLKKPLKGSIIYGDHLAKNQIGYLSQQNESHKNFPASVYEVVLSGCLNRKKISPFYSKEEKKLALEKIRLLKIEDLIKKSFQELSGGQRQRVLLARALCSTQNFLLLDEPVSGLDPQVTELMYNIVKDLNKAGMTLIMVSHDIRAAAKYASHILHLDKDQTFFGTKEAYLQSDKAKGLMKGDLCFH